MEFIFDEKREYASIMGRLMLLANNYSPGITYAVHQCAKFNNFPKSSHGAAVKHIIRYLQVKKIQGYHYLAQQKSPSGLSRRC